MFIHTKELECKPGEFHHQNFSCSLMDFEGWKRNMQKFTVQIWQRPQESAMHLLRLTKDWAFDGSVCHGSRTSRWLCDLGRYLNYRSTRHAISSISMLIESAFSRAISAPYIVFFVWRTNLCPPTTPVFQALETYAKKRTHDQKGVTIPSQIRLKTVDGCGWMVGWLVRRQVYDV